MATYFHSRAFSLLKELNRSTKHSYSLEYYDIDSSYELFYRPLFSEEFCILNTFYDALSLCDALETLIALNHIED